MRGVPLVSSLPSVRRLRRKRASRRRARETRLIQREGGMKTTLDVWECGMEERQGVAGEVGMRSEGNCILLEWPQKREDSVGTPFE